VESEAPPTLIRQPNRGGFRIVPPHVHADSSSTKSRARQKGFQSGRGAPDRNVNRTMFMRAEKEWDAPEAKSIPMTAPGGRQCIHKLSVDGRTARTAAL
jgi:hypothetical protein